MRHPLAPGCLDALAEAGTGFVGALVLDKMLGRHLERRHVGGRLAGQDLEDVEAGLPLPFILQLQRQAVAEEDVVRIVGQHRLDLLAARRGHRSGSLVPPARGVKRTIRDVSRP